MPGIKKNDMKRKLPARTAAASILALACIPAVIALGVTVLGDRAYYFVSLAIIALSMLPFVLVFEGRRPKARELVVIAVLTAIAVAGRAAFFMLPQFKPVAAVVIIAGVCFGGETGFMTGALSAFLSNFFFGQGPWTPWQMFAFGVIGFLAGILFHKGFLPKKTVPLCVFGGLSVMFIYGLLADTASALMTYASPISRPMLAAFYVSGLPFNAVHAAATVFFLLVLAGPMIRKLDRVRKKFGFIQR
jgi:energy-coupling factor transport system substrate-specific component